ncbi:MAG: GGDEF domain-containing protein [Proteobacteria bacterium]|nr:GGDEF domain-containing protein [Pseudomonadota bacterium]NOG60583.1 GGDEF domain-containing protein [Pseudomonadota bacterium]
MTDSLEKLAEIKVSEQELFNDVNFSSIKPLLSDCATRNLAKNEMLIETGDTNNNVYLILSGSFNVHLSPDNSEPVAILKPGQSIGEISIIDHQPASAYVSAAEDSRVLIIDEEVMWSLIGSSHAIANNLLVVLSQRLRHGNSVINKIKGLLKEYEHNATVDALTGLYNRRWLDSTMARVMHRCHKDNEVLCVMMIDIDRFKNYNDSYGHLAGDIALRTVSETIKQHLRPEDMVARFGGEELFALLPGMDINGTLTIAERLRIAIKQTQITNADDETLPCVTVSIGIAQMFDHDDPNKLIEAADRVMYTAKHTGRDKVCG